MGFVFGSLFVNAIAFATDLNTLNTTVNSQGMAALGIINMVSYIIGVGVGIKGILKLKEHNESQGKIPLSQPIILLIVAGCLFALPTILGYATGAVSNNASTGMFSSSGLTSVQ